MHEVLTIIHVFVCIGLVGFVLIQHGKGADAGAAFGTGASATLFGSQGTSSFLSRTTAILATVFFLTSLTLAFFSGQKIERKSIVEGVTQQESTQEVDSELPPVTKEPAIPSQ